MSRVFSAKLVPLAWVTDQKRELIAIPHSFLLNLAPPCIIKGSVLFKVVASSPSMEWGVDLR